MTAEGEKHEGTAFFALPDGSAIMHTLEGVAEPPMEAGTVAEQLPCKRSHLVPLAVKNWLKAPQRFRVEIRAPGKDASTELTGHEYVDVPASLSREYALSFFAYKEGVTNLEVHFLNEKSGESRGSNPSPSPPTPARAPTLSPNPGPPTLSPKPEP